MTKYYKHNPKLKEEMLKKWLNSQEKHKIRRNIGFVLYAIAVAVWIGCFILFNLTAIGFMVGFIFGMIPFAIGQSVITKSKNEYGRPYCRMTREFLYVDDKGVQFGYHNTQNKYTASMDVYQILYEDINRVNFDEIHNIVTIIGCGELIAYDDYSTGRINRRLSERKFYSDSCYSFILAFEDKEEFLDLLNSKKNWED